LSTLYLLALSALSLYGFLGLLTLWLYWRHPTDTFSCPSLPAELPPVTVQLPLFNERYVVDRLIRATVRLKYPTDKLQIQVLDDSTDDTTAKAAALVTYYKRKGVNISLLHRQHRQGYKAGALAQALAQAKGEFIAIFDADFQPKPDFLCQTIPHFVNAPSLGMIQTRWDHLNAAESPLTAAQAIALDKHFALEQTVRHRANLFPKFNGTGGIWRRRCLEDVGGWQDDTVCEDLCLSTRAILGGWQFRFLKDVVAPAELPTSMTAYKSQQARWAKGSIQCLRKYGRAILRAGHQSMLARLYALLSMSAYATHPLLVLLLLLQLPLVYFDYRFSSRMLVFTLAGMGQPLLFILGQQALHANWPQRLRHLPTMLLVVIGIAPSNSRAVFQAIFGRHHPFVRTPKNGNGRPQNQQNNTSKVRDEAANYQLPVDWIVFVELFLMGYAGGSLILALVRGNVGALFFLATCVCSFGYVVYRSLLEMPYT
jgi:cellulose synthase/poly-beta-1,6-N-acetylglucosamine synthase-like glycosyltransferase